MLAAVSMVLLAFVAADGMAAHVSSAADGALNHRLIIVGIARDPAAIVPPTGPAITSISPQPPTCVLRNSADAALRTLTLFGTSMATANYAGMNLNFRRNDTGAVSIHLDAEARWYGTFATADMAAIGKFLWPDPRIALSVRLTDALYQPLTAWSEPFLLADDSSSCTASLPPPVDTGCGVSLAQAIACANRAAIGDWAATQTVASINQAVHALTAPDRRRLAEVLLDSDATGSDRERLLTAMTTILANPNLGFYAEIWSYTHIALEGSGFFGGCNHVWLAPGAFASLDSSGLRNTLTHESFHSFDCVNGGPNGALDEGAAIFVYKAAWPAEFGAREDWAEATMGTKLYYRDVWQPPQPDYPISAPGNPTERLLEVYRWLASADHSHLPWNSTAKLQACYGKYYAGINRNVDFGAWLAAQAAATTTMLGDPACRPD
jgi:hypothetical protein